MYSIPSVFRQIYVIFIPTAAQCIITQLTVATTNTNTTATTKLPLPLRVIRTLPSSASAFSFVRLVGEVVGVTLMVLVGEVSILVGLIVVGTARVIAMHMVVELSAPVLCSLLHIGVGSYGGWDLSTSHIRAL